MPRVHGDTFVPIERIDYLVPHDEPLLEFKARGPGRDRPSASGTTSRASSRTATRSRSATASIPNAILANLREQEAPRRAHRAADRRHRRPDAPRRGRQHAEDARSRQDRRRPSAWARRDTYRFLDDNPAIDFRSDRLHERPARHRAAAQHDRDQQRAGDRPDRPGDRRVDRRELLQRHRRAGAISCAARCSPTAARRSWRCSRPPPTATISRIVPQLPAGTGVTLVRTDVRYIVTEYGIAYLHGKNIRDRAHRSDRDRPPEVPPLADRGGEAAEPHLRRPGLRRAGSTGEYPEQLETHRTTQGRAVDCCCARSRSATRRCCGTSSTALTDESLHRRFMSIRTEMPHERLQEFCVGRLRAAHGDPGGARAGERPGGRRHRAVLRGGEPSHRRGGPGRARRLPESGRRQRAARRI